MGKAQESRADYLEKFKDLRLMINELDKKIDALDLESDYGDEDVSPRPIKLSKEFQVDEEGEDAEMEDDVQDLRIEPQYSNPPPLDLE